MPSFPVLPESGGFLFSGSALVSQPYKYSAINQWSEMKDQQHEKTPVVAGPGQLARFVQTPPPSTRTPSFRTTPALVTAPASPTAAPALGEPSRVTPGDFGGPVDPFDPPYLPTQLVSVGQGVAHSAISEHRLLNHPNEPVSALTSSFSAMPGSSSRNDFS